MSHLELVITLIVAIFGSTGFWSWLQTRRNQKTGQGKLLMGIAYSEIITRCERYLDKGSVTTDEFHELEHYLYRPYHEMGGNGTAEKLFDDVTKLTVKDK